MFRHWLLLPVLLPLPAVAFDLDDLQRRLGDIPGLEGRFEQQRHLADLDAQLDSHGSYRYERDARVIWQLEAPVEERMEFTPDAAENIADDEAGNRRDAQVASLFLELLGGDWQALDEHFDLSLEGSDEQWHVTLTPESSALKERLERIELRGGEFLERLELNAANDDELRIEFFEQQVIVPDSGDSVEAGHADDT